LQAQVKPSVPAVEALALQIRKSGRAFGLFDVAKIVLAGRERYVVEFFSGPEQEVPLFRCRPDGSLWLSKDQAMRHFLDEGNLESVYRVEHKEVEPPKGEFEAVAVCGMTGAVLGPPNHHSFQNAVVRMHRRRFPDLPLERYKARIRIESNEEMVAKWKEAESRVTHYHYPKEVAEGQEAVCLESLEALERHALTCLGDEIVERTTRAVVPGNIPGKLLAPALLTLLRQTVEPLRTAPFPLVKTLCAELEGKGLRIFKRHGKKLFVSKTRPRAIDPAVTLSDSIRRITDLVTARPGLPVKELVALLAPRAEGTEVPEGEYTPEETALLADLHWLIDEGYLIEYASSALFLGVQPTEGLKRSGKGAAGKAAPEEPEAEVAEALAEPEAEAAEALAEPEAEVAEVLAEPEAEAAEAEVAEVLAEPEAEAAEALAEPEAEAAEVLAEPEAGPEATSDDAPAAEEAPEEKPGPSAVPPVPES
jgi:hypothetical protein